MTQHRRAHTAGVYAFSKDGPMIVAPEAEKDWLETAESYWSEWKNRWHVYHSNPGPMLPVRNVAVSETVKDGDVISWRGLDIRVLETPGPTDGSISYAFRIGDRDYCFCGDLMYGNGQLRDLHSLQKAYGKVGDYHGFMGRWKPLAASLDKIAAIRCDVLIPSSGDISPDPGTSCSLLKQRLAELWENYAAASALNHYFPHQMEDMKDSPLRLPPAEKVDPPEWVKPVAYTSFGVKSDDGAFLLVDCGNESVISALGQMRKKDEIGEVEACWVTHYHDDHVDALEILVKQLKCPVWCDENMVEILEFPHRFILPCIAPTPVPVAKSTKHGETWKWHEFELTAFHFPGQSEYHGGLLVRKGSESVLFSGDSFAPTGMDDYCAGNRCFLGENRGLMKCLGILEDTRPTFVMNQHQSKAFRFSQEHMDAMRKILRNRKTLVEALCPWDDANFALDENWARFYPYDLEARPGDRVTVEFRITNHASRLANATVSLVLPEGYVSQAIGCDIPANSDGTVPLIIQIPDTAVPGSQTIPARFTWDGRYLGQFRHFRLHVR